MIDMTFHARIAHHNYSELHSVHRTVAALVLHIALFTSHGGRALEALKP